MSSHLPPEADPFTSQELAAWPREGSARPQRTEVGCCCGAGHAGRVADGRAIMRRQPMSPSHGPDVRARQDPLRARYQEAPQEALIVDRARTRDGVAADPFHGFVVPGSKDYGVVWPFAIHSAVGGDHDG